mmetsp:Transcript_107668/g.131384  ORF Transcript_107668/g.131384 Transcript_107668/m.131384 type:complete len:243 (+) Transcript_107668:150-878(+)
MKKIICFFLLSFFIVKIINSCQFGEFNMDFIANSNIECHYNLVKEDIKIIYTPCVNNAECDSTLYQCVQYSPESCFWLATAEQEPSTSDENDVFTLQYYGGQTSEGCPDPGNRYTDINFHCNEDVNTYNVLGCGEQSFCHYYLDIETKHVCDIINNTGLSGGWIFIIIISSFFFMYCVIGYVYNGSKTKNWSDVRSNMPHFGFWTTVPMAFYAGCKVSYSWTKEKCSKKYNTETLDKDLIED